MNLSQFNQEDDLFSYKIIIVGKTSVGKTKLLTRFKYGTYTDQGSITVGVDNIIVKTAQAKFTYYDTAGQDKYKCIVSSYYRGSDACLLVYDVSSVESFEEMGTYYNTVKQTIPDCLIRIVGCKADKERKVPQELVSKYYKGYKHELTSAKNNENVKQLFKNLEEQLIITRKTGVKGSRIRKQIIIKPKDSKKQKCCE